MPPPKTNELCITVSQSLLLLLYRKYGRAIIRDNNFYVAEMASCDGNKRNFTLVYYDEATDKFFVNKPLTFEKNTGLSTKFFKLFLGYKDFFMFYGSPKLALTAHIAGAP